MRPIEELTIIAGQRAQVRKARKSIAQFKIREGMPIGARVTLRGARMYEFLDRLIAIALPRIRDFRGLNPRSFDGRGNYSLGIREQIIFPEIDYDDIQKSAASTSRSRPPRRRTSRRSRSCAASACRSPRTEGERSSMAKTSLSIKQQRPSEVPGADYTRCRPCGRPRAVFRKFGLCRICLRDLAHQGVIPGMTKIELVRRCMTDRSGRRHARPHPQRQQGAARDDAEMPTSRLKEEIARILKDEGYITDFHVEEGRELRYPGHPAEVRPEPRADHHRPQAGLEARPPRLRCARTACRASSAGWATAILSTSTGLVTSRTAAGEGIGGEVICFVW